MKAWKTSWKFYAALTALIAVGVGSYSLWPRSPRYAGIFEFRRLADGVLAEAGPFKVTSQEIDSVYYRSLHEKSREIQITLAYKQFVSLDKSNAAVTLGFAEPKRPLKDICNQYGVAFNEDRSITFDEKAGYAATVGSQKFKFSDLNLENIYWLSAQSELFQYGLETAEKLLKQKALLQVAKKAGKPVQEFVAEDILGGESTAPSADQVAAFLAETNKSGFARDVAAAYLSDVKKNEAIDSYLEKKVLQLPIAVNMQKPDYKFNLKYEWTPHLGKKTSKGVKVLVVADFFSDASQRMISQLDQIRREHPEVLIGFQPYFQNEDRYQRMAAEMSLCMWAKGRDGFWDFLKQSKKFSRENLEQEMYAAVKDTKVDFEAVKKCFLARELKPAVDYHQAYASYLGINNAPVIFIGREVFVGPLENKDIELTLSRQSL